MKRVLRRLLLATIFATALPATARPLKIFILAGQSNMEGHAKIETFDYIGDDPATAPLLKQMRSADGRPAVCDHVWISSFTGTGDENGEGFGKLTAGYGSRQQPDQDGGKIGPEFTFGLTLDAALDESVLVIKTAWGGKSLYYDFRPPGAGVNPRTPRDIEKGNNLEAQSGHYYRLMIAHVRHVLGDIKRVCPVYDGKQGYELAGFAWLQGCVRQDLNAPQMPFVIGVMGVGGTKPNEHVAAFREAMAAPASLPEFRGNVIAVPTAPFWSMELGAIADKKDQVRQMRYYLDSKHKDHPNADGHMTEEQKRQHVQDFEAKLISPAETALWQRGASNAGYHYLGCAKTFALMGQAFAEALLKAQQP